MKSQSHNNTLSQHDGYVQHDIHESVHIPVLLEEIRSHLGLTSGQIYCDATAGGGGHAHALGSLLGEDGTLVLLDQDTDALTRAQARVDELPCTVIAHNANFRNITEVFQSEDIECAHAFLFDLGWSSDQIADASRGLSFKHNGPLHMTLKKDPRPEDVTAYDIVNDWAEETIADIIYAFGDERYARRIARTIVEYRQDNRIDDTHTLVDLITKSVPSAYRHGRIHPATKTFQALRIIVNDEYGAIKEGLRSAIDHLCTHGKIAVITFHSGEDRIVKQLFNEYALDGTVTKINKKVITPSADEQRNNPRARSAKLRIIQKN